MNRKSKAALWSIGSNSILIVCKLVVGLFSGSVSIISEAIHSTLDLVAALIAFFAVGFADKPPDKDHPFGHEKIENISGVIEALLIFIAGGWIIFEAVEKIITPKKVDSLELGCITMLVSGIVNIFVSKKLYKVSKEEDSIALEADALHLKLDVYTSFGVSFGLLFISLTNYTLLDPVLAILIALIILKEAFEMLKNSFNPLMDEKLCEEQIDLIQQTVKRYESTLSNLHEIRTRKSGKIKHIDFHLALPSTMSVKDAHDLCNKIEVDLEESLKNTRVLIHIEALE